MQSTQKNKKYTSVAFVSPLNNKALYTISLLFIAYILIKANRAV